MQLKHCTESQPGGKHASPSFGGNPQVLRNMQKMGLPRGLGGAGKLGSPFHGGRGLSAVNELRGAPSDSSWRRFAHRAD
jgi:hypothetical protein